MNSTDLKSVKKARKELLSRLYHELNQIEQRLEGQNLCISTALAWSLAIATHQWKPHGVGRRCPHTVLDHQYLCQPHQRSHHAHHPTVHECAEQTLTGEEPSETGAERQPSLAEVGKKCEIQL